MGANKRYILVVENSPDDVVLILRALKTVAPDRTALVAGDAEHAIQILHDSEGPGAELPALALVDIGLPRIGGLELLERLRHDERTEALPVVLLTSSHHHLDKRLGEEIGADGYIEKSINFDDLVAALEVLSSHLD